jgi:hypothetical protein
MKKLFTPAESAQFGLARSVLEAANIPFEVRNEGDSHVFPDCIPFAPELWVSDEFYDEATRLLAETQGDQNLA